MKHQNKKQFVTLETYYKTKLVGYLSGFLTTGILIISTSILKKNTPVWVLALVILTLIIALICYVVTAVWELKKSVEQHDELSLQTLNHSHSQILHIFLWLLAVILIISLFWKKSVQVTLNGSILSLTLIGLYTFYNACVSGFFLLNEKISSEESEDSDV